MKYFIDMLSEYSRDNSDVLEVFGDGSASIVGDKGDLDPEEFCYKGAVRHPLTNLLDKYSVDEIFSFTVDMSGCGAVLDVFDNIMFEYSGESELSKYLMDKINK
jgi:hypothetical protein|tara:strand:- start:2419 stop:2730 length:312 start_codon:yes stop_codon:yes gene_type:complete